MQTLPIIAVLFIIAAILLVLKMRQKIGRLENFRRDLVANISHEFRTPLSVIKGYTETLLEARDMSPETAQNFIGKIHHHSEKLIRMIENLLKISRMENIRPSQARVFLHLPTLLKKMEEQFHSRILASRLKWYVEIKPPLNSFEIDAGLLEIVLNNLVDNAIKYSEAGGELRVAAERRNNRIQFLVADNGIGIAPEDQKKIFERFYRVDKDRARESGGTGLGLAIVKHAVRSLGGKIWVESKLGQGSKFYFTVQG